MKKASAEVTEEVCEFGEFSDELDVLVKSHLGKQGSKKLGSYDWNCLGPSLCVSG